MKIRNFLLALAVVVAIPATSQAQSDEYVMNITGTIASNVTASVVLPMDFGYIGSTAQSATGQFEVNANQATTVSVAATNLSNGTSTITLAAVCKHGADFATGTAFTGGACGATGLVAGIHKVWLQGSITAGAATAGNYTGNATLTVSYIAF